MKIEKNIHHARRWKVDEIARDFELWDVWQLPLEADIGKNENFSVLQKILFLTLENMTNSHSLTGFLFSLRAIIGKFAPLDKNINCLPIPGCRETSLRSRLSSDDAKTSKIGKPIRDKRTGLEFLNVYSFAKEVLYELSNDTVHGLLHLGWFPVNTEFYGATLAVYVKPRGLKGKGYLKLIEPFRHYIVYPYMMKLIRREWNQYKSSAKNPKSGDENE